MIFEQILKEIPKLSKAQLRKLKIQIDFFLKGASISQKTNTMSSSLEDVIFLYAKKYVLVPSKETIWANDPNRTATKLVAATNEIEKLSKRWKLDRSMTLKLVRVLVRCAVAKLDEMKIPKSFRTIVDRLSDPLSLLDDCYPGYMGSKIFRNIILNSKE